MQIHTSPDPQARLARAFADWSQARGRLGHLKAQVAGAPAARQSAQPAAAPALSDALRTQEAECARLWQELARLDEELAQSREATWMANVRACVRNSVDERPIDPVTPCGDAPVNILIVDDETSNLTALEAVLGGPGYCLVRAASGEEALLALITGEFACLVLDVQMPGMTGLELARLVQGSRHAARTPIILLTAYCKDDEHALEGYASGAADYVHKPFHPSVLRQKVEVFANLHRMNRQLHLRAAEEQRARMEMAGAAAAQAGTRAELLAAASRVPSRSPDIDSAVSAVLELCVPTLGESAFLALGNEEAATRRFELHPAHAGRNAEPFRAEMEAEAGEAVRSRELRLWRGRERAAAIVPLMTGDRARGALGILGPASGFDAARVELVKEFASRAAIVLEGVRLNMQARDAELRKDRFLAMLAHELRNPLAPISNAVQIIRGRAARPSTIDWACEVIGRQAGQMTRLIDDLLDVARLAQGKVAVKREPVALAAVVAGAVEANAPQLEQRRQAIAVELPQVAIEIQGDAARLVQALANVIDNASKFSEPGGTIRIGAACAGDEVRISVKDAGVGIAPALLPHVFDLFAQAEQSLDRPHGGLGVGLTLVRHVVELHGGRVAARSDGAGQGTEIVVHLPVRLAAAGQADAAPLAPIATLAPARAGTAPVRVLVVDDETASAETLMAVLEMKGFEVRIAHDGVAAIRAAEAFVPHVVLLDIGLPGLNGFEVAQRLRARPQLRDALLVALTGYGDAESRLRCAQAGFDSHMTKPADVDRLLPMLVNPSAARKAEMLPPAGAPSGAGGMS